MERFIGIDIGGTKCALVLGLADPALRVLDRLVFPTPSAAEGFETAKALIFAGVRELLVRNGLGTQASASIAAIGISCGGPLDSRRGLILSPPNLPGWDRVPLVDLLEAEFGVKAFLQNDANACALVEWRLGAGRGCEDMVFLTMGTGMGAGLIANGALVVGASDLAGEVGHVRLAADGPEGYGKAGSFEGFCSGGGIARLARERAAASIARGRAPAYCPDSGVLEALDAKTLIDAAKAGDTEARGLLAEVGAWLGRGVAFIIDTLNPQRIVIGSLFVRAEAFLRPAMEAELAREALPGACAACGIVAAESGEALGDLAALMVAEHGLAQRRPTAEAPGVPPASAWAASPARPGAPRTAQGFDPARAGPLLDFLRRRPDLAALREPLLVAEGLLARCFESGGTVLVCGNGGSAADAEHIVGELMKGFALRRPLAPELAARLNAAGAPLGVELASRLQGALRAISLCGHPALASAFANDVDPETVFAQQVLGYGKPGDVLIAISTSGNSRNVVNAALTARALGLSVFSLSGPGECRLAALSDARLAVPGATTAEIQEGMLPAYHALCALLELRFFGERG